MIKSIKAGILATCLLAVCVAAFPALANAAGGGAEISLRIHGGFSYLQAKDVNTGTGGYYDYYTLLGEMMGYEIEGGFSPVHGGYDFGADLVIQINPTIGIGIGAGYLRSSKDSEMTLTYLEDTASMLGSVRLSAIPIRLGVFFDFPVNDKLSFTANAGAAVYTSLKFMGSIRFEEDTSWQEIALDGSRTSFGDIGFQGGLGFEYMVAPKIGFFVEALGRYARFKNYDSVTGTNRDSGGFSDSTEGVLYLEKIDVPEGTWTWLVVEETPPTPDPPEIVYSEPKFDFSGFCLQAGFRIRF
jgi:hypothetical protein